MSEITNKFDYCDFGHWNLFDHWCLEFGAYSIRALYDFYFWIRN